MPVASLGLWAAEALCVIVSRSGKCHFQVWQSSEPCTGACVQLLCWALVWRCSGPVMPALQCMCVGPGAAGAASAAVGWLGTGVLPVASQPCSPCSETAERVKPFYVLAAKESVPGEQGCTRACPPPSDILLALPLV